MQKKYFNNLITSTLIVSTILMPLSFIPKKAEAQSISGYVSGIAPMIARLPQCQTALKDGTSRLFSGISDLFTGETGGDIFNSTDYIDPSLNPGGTSNSESLDVKVDSAIIKTSSPDTAATNKILEKSLTEQKKANATSEKLSAYTLCIQSIGRIVIKMLLQKLTKSTVAWINSGFDGKPSFIQDPEKFFNDIAKKEILTMGGEISDPEKFPFGKKWLQDTATAFNTKLQDNAEYTLEKEQQNSGSSVAAFREDFSQGGWDAWTSLTTAPANNPIAFGIKADTELQERLDGTTQSSAKNTRDALQAASGFLGDDRCSNPKDLSKTEDALGRAERAVPGSKEGSYKHEICTGGWEYVTPGKLIAEAATETIKYPNNAYLAVEDLNDAIAAISDALLAEFSSTLMEKGFANMGTEGADGNLISRAYTGELFKTQTEKDFMPFQLSSSWLSANQEFNIRTDLTQALIDEQRTYSDKLALQNIELNSTTDGQPYKLDANTGLSNTYGLIPVINQLDYCIPGPHPGWEEDSRNTLSKVIMPVAQQPKNDTLGSLAKTAVGVGLNFVPYVGPVLSSLFAGLDPENTASLSFNTRASYSGKFRDLTGYVPRVRKQTPMDEVDINVSSADGLTNVLNIILDRYIKIMNKTYFSSPDMLPEVTKESTNEFQKLTGYQQIIKDNENKILSFKTTISILQEIKQKVNALNAQYPTGGTNYEEALKAQINAFGRISADMVNGDDIANADDLVKQIVSKKDYLYNNLLKGPYGCEKELETRLSNGSLPYFPSSGTDVKGTDWSAYNVLSVKRMTYPSSLPILYDYNYYPNNFSLPDPFKSGYDNKMATDTESSNIYGPGFLSFIFFTNSDNNSDHPRAGSERLGIGDLVDGTDTDCVEGCSWLNIVSGKESFYAAVGQRERGGPEATAAHGGPFETTIGVY